MPTLKYKRVLLKLSGEALAGEHKTGIDPETVAAICGEIGTVLEMGVEMAWSSAAAIFFADSPARPKAWSVPRRTTWACWPRCSTPWPCRT